MWVVKTSERAQLQKVFITERDLAYTKLWGKSAFLNLAGKMLSVCTSDVKQQYVFNENIPKIQGCLWILWEVLTPNAWGWEHRTAAAFHTLHAIMTTEYRHIHVLPSIWTAVLWGGWYCHLQGDNGARGNFNNLLRCQVSKRPGSGLILFCCEAA